VLILGLAPAAHGGNRTGRIFTGDSSASTLMGALYRAGFASQPNSDHAYDGLDLYDAYISAICRCAPPDNKPTHQEIRNCRPYLARELEMLKNVRVVVALGKIARDGYLALLQSQRYALPQANFSHAAVYHLGYSLPTLICSYHPSQQNTQTGRLTNAMLDDVFRKTKALISANSDSGGLGIES
jgi:uracil-DNA glycosylase family 4